MDCSKCNKTGDFPELLCGCTICRDCFYDFCCPKCRRNFIKYGDGGFNIKIFKTEEGLIFNNRMIYLSSIADDEVKIFGELYDNNWILIRKEVINKLNFRYLCARKLKTGFNSKLFVDLNDFRLFTMNPDFQINYVKEIEEFFPNPPPLTRQTNEY